MYRESLSVVQASRLHLEGVGESGGLIEAEEVNSLLLGRVFGSEVSSGRWVAVYDCTFWG